MKKILQELAKLVFSQKLRNGEVGWPSLSIGPEVIGQPGRPIPSDTQQLAEDSKSKHGQNQVTPDRLNSTGLV